MSHLTSQRAAAVSIAAHLETTTSLSPGGPLIDAIEKILVDHFPPLAISVEESKCIEIHEAAVYALSCLSRHMGFEAENALRRALTD